MHIALGTREKTQAAFRRRINARNAVDEPLHRRVPDGSIEYPIGEECDPIRHMPLPCALAIRLLRFERGAWAPMVQLTIQQGACTLCRPEVTACHGCDPGMSQVVPQLPRKSPMVSCTPWLRRMP